MIWILLLLDLSRYTSSAFIYTIDYLVKPFVHSTSPRRWIHRHVSIQDESSFHNYSDEFDDEEDDSNDDISRMMNRRYTDTPGRMQRVKIDMDDDFYIHDDVDEDDFELQDELNNFPPSSWDQNDDEEQDVFIREDQVNHSQNINTQQIAPMPVRRLRRNKKIPVISIIGRPNVGKSALVNRLAGTQSGGAIVADEPGITRDRTYRKAEFLGERFQIVDTGGLVFDDSEALFAKEIREQAFIAIEESAGVIFVVDGQAGLAQTDMELAEFLRKQVVKDLPVIVAVNKCESDKYGVLYASDFWSLGLGEPMPVSALHGVGTAELLERMFNEIKSKGSAVAGFGTKVDNLKAAEQAMKNKKAPALDGETDDDVFLRSYGLYRDQAAVEKRYEDALAAFDDDQQAEEINISIIGRPNVGKSSLLNAIFGSNRAIVSDVAGTTRDSIDAVMERPAPSGSNETSTIYRFVDTAGIRRKGKVDFGPEFFMVNRALRAIRRADVGT